MTDIPEPKDSGSSGTQQPAKAEVAHAVSPMSGLPIVQTVDGLAATRSRSLGGEVAANLIAGSFNQLQHQLTEMKYEVSSVREKLDEAKEGLANEKIENAVLKGEIDSLNNEKNIRNVCLTAGPTIAAFGVDQLKSKSYVTGWLLVILGVVIAIIGWFSVGRKART